MSGALASLLTSHVRKAKTPRQPRFLTITDSLDLRLCEQKDLGYELKRQQAVVPGNGDF